jgi:hypothetical protein
MTVRRALSITLAATLFSLSAQSWAQAPAPETAPPAPAPAQPAPVQPAPPQPDPPASAPPAVKAQAAPAPVTITPPAALGGFEPGERVTTWDMNIDGAYGRVFTDPSRGAGFARVRGGILHIRDSLFFSLGATYEISNIVYATFGIQGEVMHLETGLWLQVGGLLDIDAKPGFMAAVGWSLFGVEFQQRQYDDPAIGGVSALFGKIRIPISVIAQALRRTAPSRPH